MSSKVLKGFKELPVQFSSTSSSQHTIFIKEHVVRTFEDEKPPDRTLFAINLPPYVTEDSLKNIFSVSGNVENVIFQKKSENTCSFKIAYIVFEKPEGLAKALQIKNLLPLNTEKQPLILGLNKWKAEYNKLISSHDQLQKQVETFILAYDKEEQIGKKKEKQVDDDGWTIVTKKGRKPGNARKESFETRVKEKMKKKAKHKELQNFYTFQIRESKKKHIEELRKRYEADKNKINILKQARKFKPF